MSLTAKAGLVLALTVAFSIFILNCLHGPSEAATRLYLQNANSAVTTTTQGAWSYTTGAPTLVMARTKSGAVTSRGVAETNATNTYDVMILKFVSEPIPAQTIAAASTLNWVIGALESNTAANDYWAVHAYVVSNNGATVRGTLLANNAENTTNEWPTTAQGWGTQAAKSLTAVTAQANDRIVIEIGYIARNAVTTSYTGTLWYGGTGGDLTATGDETTLTGWFEFSQDLFPSTTVGDGTAPANKFAKANDTNKAVSAFTLSTNVGTDTITGMIITGTNTGNVAANGVKIYQDNGTVPNEWDASDTQAGTGVSFSGTTATFTGLNISVTTTVVQYLITYDISSAPTDGQTLTGFVSSVTAANTVINNDNADATITIDTAAPTTTASAAGYAFGTWSATTPISVSLSVSDGTGSGIAAGYPAYCVDTTNTCSPATSYSAPFNVTCAVGSTCIQYVRYQSVDNAGNVETVKSSTVMQDLQLPATTDNQTSSNWQTTEKAIILTPNDGTGSGVTAATGIYGCFGASCVPAVLGSNTMTTNCGAGNECTYDVRYYSIDNVGNTEAVKTSSYQARIDRKSPTDGTISAVPGNALVSLSWSGFSDAGSGMNATDAYKLVFLTTGFPNAGCTNGTDLTAVTTQTSYTHSPVTNGTTYYYRLCAYDSAGNISTGVTASATPTTVCVRANPSVSISPVAQNVIQGASAGYIVSVTNNDNSNCTATTFNLSKTDAPVVPNANFSASTLPATIGPINPAATATVTLTHTATAGATINSTEQTYVTSAADGNGHTAVQSNTVTTTVRLTSGDGYLLKRAGKSTEDELCHGCHKTDKNAPSDANSIKTHSSEWLGTCSNSTYKNRTDCIANSGTWTHGEWNASGGWGIAGAKYGKMLCTTCHTGHNTANIYIVKEAITTPDGSNFQGRATNSATVNFRKKTGTPGEAMVNGNMGDDSDNHTTSTRVCEVCHTYNATDAADGVKYHGYNMGTNPGHKNAEDCIGCHSHKVAFQAGESNGGASCEGCHSDLWGQMRTTTTTGYHHALNNANATYATIAQNVNMGGSTDTNRNCLICHVDHDIFRPDINTTNGGRGKNLRASISTTPVVGTPATYSNTDFISTETNGGICMSCHRTSQTTMGYSQPDGSTAKPAIPYTDTAANQVAAYNASAHQYNVASTYSGGLTNTFNANCTKCHNDTLNPKSSYNAQTSTNKFGNHQSTLRRVEAPLGIASPADPLEEQFCYRCHSKAADNIGGTKKSADANDWYGTYTTMAAKSTAIYQMFQKGGYGTTSSNILYLRNLDTINAVPPTKPGAYQYSSGTYTTNTFNRRDMSPASGATGTTTVISTGNTAARYDRGIQFVSPQIDQTVTIASGSTFTLTIRTSRATGTSTDYARFFVYKWNGTTATPVNTTAAPNNFAQHTTAISTTATNQTWSLTSNQDVTLNPGDAIVCDVEFYHSAGTTALNVTFAYGNYGTDAAALQLPNAYTYVWRTAAASGTKHNIAGYTGVHDAIETTSASFSGAQRHVECEDCHNPHSATSTNPLAGATGVDPTNSTAGAAPTAYAFGTVTDPDLQYKVCFKCHTDWAGYGTGTQNLAVAFNPANDSFHWVEKDKYSYTVNTGTGKGIWQNAQFNQTAVPTQGTRTYVQVMMPGRASYTDASLRTTSLRCSDCHGPENADGKTTIPEGPHGSANANILKVPSGSPYTTWNATVSYQSNSGTIWCFNCHHATFTGTGMGSQHTSNHNGFACQQCHIAIPHGQTAVGTANQRKHLLRPDVFTEGADSETSGSWSQHGTWVIPSCT